MEENKKCCESKMCEKDCHMGGCCCMMKKCHGMKFLVLIIVMIVIFCLGVQLGELKSEARGGREFRGNMMDWNYKVVNPVTTADTTPNTPPTTTTPAQKQ